MIVNRNRAVTGELRYSFDLSFFGKMGAANQHAG